MDIRATYRKAMKKIVAKHKKRAQTPAGQRDPRLAARTELFESVRKPRYKGPSSASK